MKPSILTLNAGSSSIKFSLFSSPELEPLYYGLIDDILAHPTLWIKDANGKIQYEESNLEQGHLPTLNTLLTWLKQQHAQPTAIGHRVVHGGKDFKQPVIITQAVIQKLNTLIPLAPLHQPHNIAVIEQLHKAYPNTPQIACFDTAFHHTQPNLHRHFPLPKTYTDQGVIRYGFHGLSYQYIASVLPEIAGPKAQKHVIIAHLGNGSSLCAMHKLTSVATTMGFTPLDGLMMGTRCGAIDPGILLYLLEHEKLTAPQLSHVLHHQCGLKAVSGISHDIRELLASTKKEAKHAIDLFCYQAAKQLAELIVPLGGLDLLVFTAGIGENAAPIRHTICNHLAWLGLALDETKNNQNQQKISRKNSKIDVYVIPTNEELMIAKQTLQEHAHE